MANLLGLLDLDSWVYRCGFAAEKTYYLVEQLKEYGDGQDFTPFTTYKEANNQTKGFEDCSVIWSRKEIEPVENCLQTVKTSLENTVNVLGLTSFTGYLSGRGNFRNDIFPEYKANRETVGKPKHYRAVRDYLVREWGAVLVDGMEADDAIGIAAKDAERDFIVVGVDKDLDQIVGEHYNWVSGERYTVGAQRALRFFYEQLLSGDPTDNVPGINGIGPVKARKLLEPAKTPAECAGIVAKAYRDAYGDGYSGIVDRNAHLIWIKRTKEDSHPFFKHLGA